MTERIIREAELERFREYLTREEKSAGTIGKYLRDIRAFAAYAAGRGVTKELAISWKDKLVSEGYAPVTINSMLSSLNGFFYFMRWDDCKVKFLRVQRRMFRDSSRVLTRSEYERLLSTAQAQGRERLALLMETICATGIRVSEVKYITVEAACRGMAEIALKGKIRTILLPSKLCRKLIKYAKRKKIASGEIFLTRSGAGMSRKQIWAEMKSLCRAAGVEPSKVFPHNLRHLFARVFYKLHRDIVKLADTLGPMPAGWRLWKCARNTEVSTFRAHFHNLFLFWRQKRGAPQNFYSATRPLVRVYLQYLRRNPVISTVCGSLGSNIYSITRYFEGP